MTTTNAKPSGITQKLGGLLGSLRFWTVTLSAASLAVAHPERLWEIASGWFGAVTAIGTADSVAEKMSSKKPTP